MKPLPLLNTNYVLHLQEPSRHYGAIGDIAAYYNLLDLASIYK